MGKNILFHSVMMLFVFIAMPTTHSAAVEKGENISINVAPGQGNHPVATCQLTGMEFVFIKGGCFDMGDTFGDGEDDERPVHEVCVDDFYIGKYEVTVGEFKKFVDQTDYKTTAEESGGLIFWYGTEWKKDKYRNWKSPGFSLTDRHSVVGISWNDTQKFISWLNENTGNSYRLPTEAEWEYAARSGGKREKFAGTSSESELEKYAWYGSNSKSKAHPVGDKKPNGLGLYDMTGNVWEWVQDIYNDEAYKKHQSNNPVYNGIGSLYVIRGGSWRRFPKLVPVSQRLFSPPKFSYNYLGFRLTRKP